MYKVIKETEKAVAISNEIYEGAKEVASYDLKELTSEQINALRVGKMIWLPKSQVVVENGFVIDMPDWLANRNNLITDRMISKAKARFEKGCNRYEKALKFAKENGLSVRNKMKLDTILKAIKQANLVFEF